MNTLGQYQPLLHANHTAAQVAQQARDIRSWVQSVDQSPHDSNTEDCIIDHAEVGRGLEVQAKISNLGPTNFTVNGQPFELNRLLTRHDGSKIATQVQVFEGVVAGYEVTQWPDGTCKGYQFQGSPSCGGPISQSPMDDSSAKANWTKVYISTLPIEG